MQEFYTEDFTLLISIFSDKVEPGSKYILIDDFLTQGETINELRAYIEGLGGKVVGVIAAGQSKGGNILTLKPQTAKLLINKFGRDELENFLKEENIAEKIEGLTEGQARALLAFSNLNSLRDRIAKERSKRSPGADVAAWQEQFKAINPDYPHKLKND